MDHPESGRFGNILETNRAPPRRKPGAAFPTEGERHVQARRTGAEGCGVAEAIAELQGFRTVSVGIRQGPWLGTAWRSVLTREGRWHQLTGSRGSGSIRGGSRAFCTSRGDGFGAVRATYRASCAGQRPAGAPRSSPASPINSARCSGSWNAGHDAPRTGADGVSVCGAG